VANLHYPSTAARLRPSRDQSAERTSNCCDGDPLGLCRSAAAVAKLAADQQDVCRSAYAEGLRSAMMTTTLLFIPAGLCFYWSSWTLKRDMVAAY